MVSGSHGTLTVDASGHYAYALNNTDAAVVALPNGGTLTDTLSVSPTDSTPADNTVSVTTAVAEGTIALTVMPISTTEFAPLNNVGVATFTHANGVEPASAFSATINWGDGTTTAGTVTQSGTTYTVVGSHTYNPDSAGPVTVTVSEDGVSATASAAVSIAEAPVPAGALGLPQESFIFETMDDLFNQPLSLFQLQGLEISFLFVEISAANLFTRMGSSSAVAFNLAQGGAGGSGGRGGDGLGGGLFLFSRPDTTTSTTVTVTGSSIQFNAAVGGHGGSGGVDGEGKGGGVYSQDATLSLVRTLLRRNFASTSNDDLFQQP